MRWTVHGRRKLYESEWVSLWVEDVELPDGQRLQHHVLRMPRRSITVVVPDQDGERVLLLWRHRFITDTWGWEVPAGWTEGEESLEETARREVEEETGWTPLSLTRLTDYYASPAWPIFTSPCFALTVRGTSARLAMAPRRAGWSGSRLPTSPSSSMTARSPMARR